MIVYRHRLRIIVVAVAVIILATMVRLAAPPEAVADAATVATFAAVIALVVAFGISSLTERILPTVPARTVHAPVHGRWLAMNSPATKVPSHGTRAYGQAHAIDLTAEPDGITRPQFGDGPGFRSPEDFPAFGEPVHAMVAGTVVSASSRHRDHRSRSSYPALLYMTIAAAARELGGPGFVVGNHVTIRTDDGVFALVAHLQHESLRVQVGDQVRAGETIGACGNTGNSSEPHVHAQLMDRRSLWSAQGLPMAFAGISVDGVAAADTMPANDQHMVAPAPEADSH